MIELLKNESITRDQIQPFLQGVGQYYATDIAFTTMTVEEFLYGGRAPSFTNYMRGNHKIQYGYENLITTKRLKGEKRRILNGSYIIYDRFRLPEDMSVEGITEHYFQPQDTARVFGRIAITELGLSLRYKRFVGYFASQETGLALALDGLEKYLNKPDEAFLDRESIESDIATALTTVNALDKVEIPKQLAVLRQEITKVTATL